ncbi:MAG: NAD+ synthase [Dehalococcoidia bacterium]|nr:NAD+ synthase [Dehalococcoidia bacterium]
MRTLRLGLAQINTTVGDLDGNAAKVLEYVGRARELGVDVLSFPEMTITGYPPEDLLLRPQFIRHNLAVLERVVKGCQGITAVVGFVDRDRDIHNAAAIIHDGRLVDVYHKQFLPNYGVFDENRYFQAGTRCPVYVMVGIGVGVSICEDIWYPEDPTRAQAHAGAQVIININGSPYHMGKRDFREHMLATRASDYAVFISYTNQVGGQDELVFDGASMVVSPRGEVLAQAAAFEEELLICDLDVEETFQARLHEPRRRKERTASGASVARVHVSDEPLANKKPPVERRHAPSLGDDAEVYDALVLGTRDYLLKNGFRKAVIGLSGGVDSSLVAAIAVDALGGENVVGVAMPSRFSSEGSISDARELADSLGIQLMTIPIEEPFTAFLGLLSEPFAGSEFGVTEENIQSRIRGLISMALSNKFGWLVLATGNKSEMATGYATLYGDMAGGFAVIKDVPKTLVYRLARHRNGLGPKPVIPQSVIEKEPSAELRPNQRDADTLPPYETLDSILEAYVEEDKSVDEIAAMGFDEGLVKRVMAKVDGSEYKRRQAPPGVKISPRAFGRDRRLPIANRYRGY